MVLLSSYSYWVVGVPKVTLETIYLPPYSPDLNQAALQVGNCPLMALYTYDHLLGRTTHGGATP